MTDAPRHSNEITPRLDGFSDAVRDEALDEIELCVEFNTAADIRAGLTCAYNAGFHDAMQISALIARLEEAEWHAVADDLRNGTPPKTVLVRLRSIGEGDNEAAQFIESAQYPEDDD